MHYFWEFRAMCVLTYLLQMHFVQVWIYLPTSLYYNLWLKRLSFNFRFCRSPTNKLTQYVDCLLYKMAPKLDGDLQSCWNPWLVFFLQTKMLNFLDTYRANFRPIIKRILPYTMPSFYYPWNHHLGNKPKTNSFMRQNASDR